MDVEEVADILQRYHPREVRLSGHGESTMLGDWVRTARLFLERGFEVTLTTNLAKRLSDEEIEVLTYFRSLEISIDSADPELLARLRRGVRLERLEENIAQIVRACRDSFRELPYLNGSCVVADVCVAGLCDLVRWTGARGMHALGLVNMERYPDPPGAIEIRHPAEVDPIGALESIAKARELARELGLNFTVEPALSESLEDARACL